MPASHSYSAGGSSTSLPTTQLPITRRARYRADAMANVNVQDGVFLQVANLEYNTTTSAALQNATEMTGLVGDLRFITQLNLGSSVQRATIDAELVKNGAVVARVRADNYLRGLSAADTSNVGATFEVENSVAADTYQIRLFRTAVAGNVALVSTDAIPSYVFVDETQMLDITNQVTPAPAGKGFDVTGFSDASGTSAVDFFSDGGNNGPFNLQVRNTTNQTQSYTAVITDTPYELDPATLNLNGATYVGAFPRGDNFDHVFEVTLEAFANVAITGPVPSPTGNNTPPAIYNVVV